MVEGRKVDLMEKVHMGLLDVVEESEGGVVFNEIEPSSVDFSMIVDQIVDVKKGE